MSEPRYTTDGDWILRDGVRYAASRTNAAVIVAQLNRLDAAEALIAEMRAALAAAIPWVATALFGRDDAHPQAVANHLADRATLAAAFAKAEAWEASRAD